jgi:hypothetical protein
MVKLVAHVWLRKEDWPRWQEIDPELPSYDRWLTKENATTAEFKRKGIAAERIVVEPDRFLDWCRTNNKPVHRNTRSAYAAMELMKRISMH